MKNSFIASLIFTLAFLPMQFQRVIAMDPLQFKKGKEERSGWFLDSKQHIAAKGLLDRMTALLGQINRNYRHPTSQELEQIRGRYEELMDILEQYDSTGNVIPMPQEWRQAVGLIEQYFNYWAQLKNEPYLHEPREALKIQQQQTQEKENLARVEIAMIEDAIAQSIIKQTQTVQKQWEFSNQSEKMATIFTSVSSGCYQYQEIHPGDDYGPITLTQRPLMLLYTSAGAHVISVDANADLLLEKEAKLESGLYDFKIIKTMPFDEAQDILFIINPHGEVDFVKRNRSK